MDLAAALRALSEAGLPEAALRTAVEALLRAAQPPSAAVEAPPRLLGGA